VLCSFLYECVSVSACVYGESRYVDVCLFLHSYETVQFAVHGLEVCICFNIGAWLNGASFDTMKADKRETGPRRHVGAAN